MGFAVVFVVQFEERSGFVEVRSRRHLVALSIPGGDTVVVEGRELDVGQCAVTSGDPRDRETDGLDSISWTGRASSDGVEEYLLRRTDTRLVVTRSQPGEAETMLRHLQRPCYRGTRMACPAWLGQVGTPGSTRPRTTIYLV